MKSLDEMDAETDAMIDQIVLQGVEGKAPPQYIAMINKPFRDYIKILNRCQDKDVEPEDVMQSTSDMVANMIVELMVRLVARSDTGKANMYANRVLSQIAIDMTAKMGINFGAGFEMVEAKGATKQ